MKAFVLAALIILGLAVPLAEAQDKKAISVSWTPGLVGKSLQEVFGQTYPGKDLLRITELGDSPRFTQMQANRSSPNLDACTFIDVLMPLVIKSNLLEKLDARTIPNLKNITPGLRVWGDYAVPYAYGVWGIIYDADKVKKPITSWGDLLRSDLKGYVTAPNIVYNSSFYTLDALARLKGGDLKNPAAGLQAMRQIRLSGPGLWDEESVMLGWLKTGEVWASPEFSGNALRLIKEEGATNLRFVVPVEGGYLVSQNIDRIANSPNPAGGDDFVNYVLSRKAQERYAAVSYAHPSNKDAKVPADVAAVIPPAGKLRKLDFYDLAARRSALVEQWDDVVNQ